MKTQTLHTEEASNKYAAYMNARVRSYAASTGYSDRQKIEAERMKVVLSIVYMFKDIYVTYRKKFITVKLDQARVADKVSLSELESCLAINCPLWDKDQVGTHSSCIPGITMRPQTSGC